MNLKEKIEKLVLERDDVSCVEIERFFPEVKEPESDSMSIWSPAENLIIWTGWTEEAYTALIDLIKDDRIAPKACSFLIYMVDGARPGYPIAKRLRAYKKPHWIPMTFCKPKKREIRVLQFRSESIAGDFLRKK